MAFSSDTKRRPAICKSCLLAAGRGFESCLAHRVFSLLPLIACPIGSTSACRARPWRSCLRTHRAPDAFCVGGTPAEPSLRPGFLAVAGLVAVGAQRAGAAG